MSTDNKKTNFINFIYVDGTIINYYYYEISLNGITDYPGLLVS